MNKFSILLLLLTLATLSFGGCNKKAADKSQTSAQQKSDDEGRTKMSSEKTETDSKSSLPGYTPTGNQEVDEQNYSKAKENLYNNDPEGYKAWVQSMNSGNNGANQAPPPSSPAVAQPATPQIHEIPYAEYIQMPQAKRDHIDAHPELYKVVK